MRLLWYLFCDFAKVKQRYF